jgi:hypothetical protein
MKELGGVVEKEYVIIGKWPVQILPAYTPLVEAAVANAPPRDFEDLKVRVVDANYLCAIALQTGRSKDYQRVHTLIESGHVDGVQFNTLVQNYNLIERWETYVHRFPDCLRRARQSLLARD